MPFEESKEEVRDYEETSRYIHQTIDELERRLSPVMRQFLPKEATKGKSLLTPVQTSFVSIKERLNSLVERISI